MLISNQKSEFQIGFNDKNKLKIKLITQWTSSGYHLMASVGLPIEKDKWTDNMHQIIKKLKMNLKIKVILVQ